MNEVELTTTFEEMREFFHSPAPKKGCAYKAIGWIGSTMWYAVKAMWDGEPYVRIAYPYGEDADDFYGGNGWDGGNPYGDYFDGDDDYFDDGLTAFRTGEDDHYAKWALARFGRIAEWALSK